LIHALEIARQHEGSPAMIVAHTIKGKGVSFMENRAEWHSKVPQKHQIEEALNELQYETQKAL
jgi:transketolase